MILLIAGTRPEIIKTAPIVIEAKKHDCRIHYCLTGQHKTMAQEALSIFAIKSDDNLEIMCPNQTLNTISESVFAKLPAVIDKVKPNVSTCPRRYNNGRNGGSVRIQYENSGRPYRSRTPEPQS